MLLATAGCSGGQAVDRPPLSSSSVTISIVGTTDVHGALSERDGRGGLPLLAGYVRNLRAARAADNGGVVLVDAGDMFQGTLESNLTEGAAVVAAYNALGYSAAAIGNHEFDFGPVGPPATARSPGDDPRGALKARAAEARFPLLTANVLDERTGAPVSWPNVAPSALMTVAGIPVGMVGVTSADTPFTTIAANLTGLTVAPLVPAIVREASSLRARGAAIVVVAAHAGGRCGRVDVPTDLSSCEMTAEIVQVAQQLPRGLVDVMVGGHTHNVMAHQVNGVSIVQPGASGRAFSRVDLSVDRGSRRVTGVRVMAPHEVCAREVSATRQCDPAVVEGKTLTPTEYEGRPVVADATVRSAIEPALRAVETLKASRVGIVLATPFPRSRLVESPLGNMFADATRETMKADAAMVNGGGIRTDLPAGDLLYGRLYEAFPFENKLVVVTLRGEQLRRILAANLEPGAPQPISVSGLTITASCRQGRISVALHRPVRRSFSEGGSSGRPVGDAEPLRVVVTDFVLGGGDGILAPAGAIDATVPPDAPLMRDAIADWLRRRGGSLRAEQFFSAGAKRWQYSGQRPLRCS